MSEFSLIGGEVCVCWCVRVGVRVGETRKCVSVCHWEMEERVRVCECVCVTIRGKEMSEE